MKNIKEFIKKFFKSLKDSFSYYPITISLCIIFAILFVFRTEYMDFASQILKDRIDTAFLGLGIAILGSMNIQLLVQSIEKLKKKQIFIWISFFILVVIYYIFGIQNTEMTCVVRALIIMGILFSTYIYIPWHLKTDEVEKFSVRFMIESVISSFYAYVLFGGLMLINFAFETLMDINPEHEFYVFALAFSTFIVLPMLIFSRIQEQYKQSKILKILITNIVMPLLLAYTVVLYMYFIRMIFLWEIPSNMITNLVFWYVLIGIFVLFVISLYGVEKKWLKVFNKAFPILTMLPLGLMFIALIIRVKTYGFTEPRYTMLIIGIWMLLVILYFIFTNTKKRVIAVLPVSLALVSLLLIASPFNMFSVSTNSQNAQFDSLYSNIEKLDETQKSSLLSIVQYFENSHSLDEIDNYPSDMTVVEFQEEYELRIIYHEKFYYGTSVIPVDDLKFVKTSGYDYVIFNFWQDTSVEDENSINMYYEERKLIIKINEEEKIEIDMYEQMKTLYEKYKNRETNEHIIELKTGENTLIYDTNNWKIKILLGEFYINENNDTKLDRPSNIIVLIGKK